MLFLVYKGEPRGFLTQVGTAESGLWLLWGDGPDKTSGGVGWGGGADRPENALLRMGSSARAPMGSGMRSQCPEGRHRPLLGSGATPSRVQLPLASSGLEVGADKNVPPEPPSQTRGPSRRLQLPKCPAPQLRRSRMLLSKRGGPAGRRTGRVSGRSAGNPAAAILAGSNQLGAQGEARVLSLASS